MTWSTTSVMVPSMYFTSTSYFRIEWSSIILHFLFVLTTNLAASAVLPTVADNPTLVIWYFVFAWSLSRLSDSWAPLSLPNSSWTSSITIHSISSSAFSITGCVRSMIKVSGVVIRISGGERFILRLIVCDVSPCLTSILRPSFSAYLIILLKTSRFSARSGVMYSTLILSSFLERETLENIGITAVSVFPEPVGATTRESIF